MRGVIIAVCRVLVYYISYLKFDFLIFDYLSRTAEIEEHKPNSRDEQNNQHSLFPLLLQNKNPIWGVHHEKT